MKAKTVTKLFAGWLPALLRLHVVMGGIGMNRTLLLFALIALVPLAFAYHGDLINPPVPPLVLGCEDSHQNVLMNCSFFQCEGSTATVCNTATGVCNSTFFQFATYPSGVYNLTLRVLKNGSVQLESPYKYWPSPGVTRNQICPISSTSCRLNLTVPDGERTVALFDFSGDRQNLCAHAYLEENHFRNDTVSNFSITPHNLGGFKWSCSWNASANALYLPGSYTTGSWVNVSANETQNVSLAIGTDIANASIQYGQIVCTDQFGAALTVYRSGCGYGMGCQESGASWTWAALIPESFRIINPNDGTRDSVASIPGVAYAHERITGLRLRVVDAITYTDNVAVRSFRVNFTLPAQCSMAQTLKYFSQYSWTGVAGGMSLDENQVYTLSWSGDPIVCTAPANITLEINASESVWPPGVMESDTIAYSPAAVVTVLSPEFTIDNVQAFENYAEGSSSDDPITNGTSGLYDFWASISHKFTRTPISDLENVSCTAYFQRGMGIYFGNATVINEADGSYAWFDVNYSRDTFTGTWNIQCGTMSAGGNETFENCANETSVEGNRTNYTQELNTSAQDHTATPVTVKVGPKFTVTSGDMVLSSIVKVSTTTATTAYLLDASKNPLVNATFDGDVAVFDYNLTNGTMYYAVLDGGGGSYVFSYDPDPPASPPLVRDNVTITAILSDMGGLEDAYPRGVWYFNVTERPYNVTTRGNCTNETVYTNGTLTVAANVTGTGLIPTERLLRQFQCVREPTEKETSDPWVVYYDANYPYSTESGKYVCTAALEGYAFDSAYLYRTPPQVSNASGVVSACLRGVLGTTTGTTPCYTFETVNSASSISLVRSLAFVPSAQLVRFTPQDASFSVGRYGAMSITANGTAQYELNSAASLDLMLRARPKVIVRGTEFKVIAKAAGNTGGNLSETGDALKCSVSATGVIGGQVDASIDIYTIDSLGRVGCRSKGFDKPTLEITHSNVSPAWDTYTWSYIIYGMGTDPSCNSTRMKAYLNSTAGGTIQCDAAVRYVSADGGVRNMPNEPVHLLVAASAGAQCTGGDCSSWVDLGKNGVAGFVGGILAWSFSSWENFAITFAIPLGLIITMPLIVAFVMSPTSAVIVGWLTRRR